MLLKKILGVVAVFTKAPRNMNKRYLLSAISFLAISIMVLINVSFFFVYVGLSNLYLEASSFFMKHTL